MTRSPVELSWTAKHIQRRFPKVEPLSSAPSFAKRGDSPDFFCKCLSFPQLPAFAENLFWNQQLPGGNFVSITVRGGLIKRETSFPAQLNSRFTAIELNESSH